MLVNVRTVGLFVAQSSLSRGLVQGSTVCLPKKKFRFNPFGERNGSLLQMLNVDAYLTLFCLRIKSQLVREQVKVPP